MWPAASVICHPPENVLVLILARGWCTRALSPFLVTFSQLLAAEVGDSGIRVQVVGLGVVHSEFHSRQGIDVTSIPQIEPRQVVEASLADLADEVVVSVPGLADTGSLTRLEGASGELHKLNS
jgi:short-subunit dehydrogenase